MIGEFKNSLKYMVTVRNTLTVIGQIKTVWNIHMVTVRNTLTVIGQFKNSLKYIVTVRNTWAVIGQFKIAWNMIGHCQEQLNFDLPLLETFLTGHCKAQLKLW